MYLRIVIALQTVAVFLAPITAGLLLSSPSGHVLHSAAAYTVFTVAVVHVITAILVWRPGGGSPRPIAHAAGFLALTLAQVALGIAHVLTLHVPLGVLMFGVSVLQLSRHARARGDAGRSGRGVGVAADVVGPALATGEKTA
ncbi:hypothetical protein SAMN05421874_13274 [Nonomuraea maritima]|uniref:Uncharacterized protein n=1 Tax=Nonomuraea maritima TaxID=683260 RepID=A0A1G9NZC3_9ACTN|nr:hypothetical protein [Nonomuraea maritima]SDL91325.1 hypothetical protein SAMN05421874_13274 [Nonomuraea maritima]